VLPPSEHGAGDRLFFPIESRNGAKPAVPMMWARDARLVGQVAEATIRRRRESKERDLAAWDVAVKISKRRDTRRHGRRRDRYEAGR